MIKTPDAFTNALRKASVNDIAACFALEERLREDRPRAADEGFLLSGGDTVEKYRELVSYGTFYVVDLPDRLAGFLFALPPDSPRIIALLGARAKFDLTRPEVFDLPQLAWLAKVGIEPDHMGRGVATALYRALLREHPDWNFLTTTVRSPMRNIPSEQLQARFGFEQIGTLPLGDRGTLRDVICAVHFREAGRAVS